MSDRSRGRSAAQRGSRSGLDRRAARSKIIIVIMALLMALSLLAVPLTQLISSRGDDGAQATDEPAEPADPVLQGPYDAPFDMTIDTAADYRARIDTDLGVIIVRLDASGAPMATNNLVNLAEDGYYDDVVFHRVIDGFVIQTGDPTALGAGGPGYRFPDELDTARALVAEHNGYPRGTVAMANAGPDTNGSQFFVVQGDLVELPPAYTVFGAVEDGMDVVDAIAGSPTDAADRPFDDIAIRSITITAG